MGERAMTPRESAYRASCRAAGAMPDLWHTLRDIGDPGLEELARMMPLDLAGWFRRFLDEEPPCSPS